VTDQRLGPAFVLRPPAFQLLGILPGFFSSGFVIRWAFVASFVRGHVDLLLCRREVATSGAIVDETSAFS
jgi:hypothetical protein